MATTGLYYQTITFQQVIDAALRTLRVISAGQVPSAQDVTDGLFAINQLLPFWSVGGLYLWTFDQQTLPLIKNQTSYTLGSGGDLDPGYRPLRMLEGTFIRYTLNNANYDSPLRIISRQEYDQFGTKSTLGIPNSVYYDNQMGEGAYDPLVAKGVLYVYPTPMDNTRAAVLQMQRPLQFITVATDNFDVSPEMYRILRWGLANEIMDMYEVPEDRCARVTKTFDKMYAEMMGWSTTEQASTYFAPDVTMYGRRR